MTAKVVIVEIVILKKTNKGLVSLARFIATAGFLDNI
jgi:hypothetical protein